MARWVLLLTAALHLAAAPPRVLDLDGNLVDVLGGEGARAVVLVFVAVDCPISNRYAPELERLERELARRGVSFFLVYPEPSLEVETARRHTKDFSLTFPALLDREHDLVEHTGVEVVPEAAVLGRDGAVLYRGRIDDRWVDIGTRRPRATTHDLEAAIASILAGETPLAASGRAVGCYIEPLPGGGGSGGR